MKKTIYRKLIKQTDALKLTITFEATYEYEDMFEFFKQAMEKSGVYKAFTDVLAIVATVEKDVRIKADALKNTLKIVSKNCILSVVEEILTCNIKN